MFANKKIAIVYDWFDKWGGVERIILILKEIFPEADFFTSYVNFNKAFWIKNFKIKTSFIQKLPDFIKKNRLLSLPFYPIAFELFNFDDYDLVISVTSSFAKGIITKPKTKHICYLLTPTRFLWSHYQDYFKNRLFYFFVKKYLDYLKKWDKITSKRPDKIISISKTVKERIKKYYQLESEVIYPPFDIDYWEKIRLNINEKKIKEKLRVKNEDFYLVVSRLEPYKKVDLVIKAFNKLKKNLVVVGDGSQKRYLKSLANKNIRFFSYLNDEELGYLYSKSQALIMPQNEDFGYVSLEAQFFYCPVIAYNQGGAKETILQEKTGIFFNKQEEKALINSIERFNKIKYNLLKQIKKWSFININKFQKEKFVLNFKNNL